MTEDDKVILAEYLKDGLLKKFEQMLIDLSKDYKKHPWNRSLPWYTKFGLKFAKYFVLTLYLWLCFVLIQLALFNLILLGIMLLYLGKIADLFTALIIKSEVKYQNKDFKAFLERQEKDYKNKITLTPGIMGKWIEVHLTDREEEAKNTITPGATFINPKGGNT